MNTEGQEREFGRTIDGAKDRLAATHGEPSATVPWVDEETLEAIHWHAYWDAFAPVTVYGLHMKQALKPYLPGFEGEAEIVWRQLREDASHWSLERVQNLRQRLRQLPDIRDTLRAVAWSTAPLTPKHFLALKQFAVRGLHLSLSDAVQRSDWQDPSSFARLVSIFTVNDDKSEAQAASWTDMSTRPRPKLNTNLGLGAQEIGQEIIRDIDIEELASSVSESFSLEEFGSPEYKNALVAVTSRMQRVAKLTREQNQYWLAKTGAKIRHDGHLVIPRPSQQDVAQACKEDLRLKWLRDTPYESIFEVLPSSELTEAEAALDAAKETLTAAEQHELLQLTRRVQELLSEWEEAVDAVAELDCRVAKVQMLRALDGCVPELGLSMSMESAIQPEVSRRLASEGQAFTPITLRPEDGVNILFGSNMGGKTLSMSVLVGCQLLAQYGLPVPADAFHTRLFSAIRFAATSGTDVHSGLSAYGAEVVRVSACWEALRGADPVLTMFDEPVRSTNPIEGSALVTGLVRASLVQTKGTQSVVWVATHFADPLLEHGTAKFRVRGLHQGSPAGSLTVESPTAGSDHSPSLQLKRLEDAMDYRIDKVSEFSAYHEALPVAEYLGAPSEWLDEAKAFLREGKRT